MDRRTRSIACGNAALKSSARPARRAPRTSVITPPSADIILRPLVAPLSPALTPATRPFGVSIRTARRPSSTLASGPPASIPKSDSNSAPKPGHAAMPSMPATAGHSAACCNIPPVLSDGYEEKGSYIEELGGFKTYATGPDDAEKAILVVFDIFGYFPQTIQGADILSTSDDHQKYKVFMPDFFHGNPCPIEWYPPDTEQKMKDVGAWFGQHPPQGVADKLPALVKAIEAKYPSIKSWGIIGYCFGGKVTSIITASDSNPFKIAAEAHPAMVDPEEADKIRVPLIMLASKDEPADKVKEFEDKLKVAKHVEIFGDQIHGWMAARSDLKDPRVKEEYVRGYETVLSFFGKNWA